MSEVHENNQCKDWSFVVRIFVIYVVLTLIALLIGRIPAIAIPPVRIIYSATSLLIVALILVYGAGKMSRFILPPDEIGTGDNAAAGSKAEPETKKP